MNSSSGDFDIREMGCDGASPPQGGQPVCFRADDCLLGVLARGRERERAMLIEVVGVGVVSADFQRGVYYANVRSETGFFTANLQQVQIEQGGRAVEAPERPLEELMWKAAYYGSSGRLLEGCNLYDVVELQRWPNFTRLPHATCCLPLCSLLARRPSSIAFAHRMLRVPPADAMRFYSAARSAGYLRVISSQPESGEREHAPANDRPAGSSADSSSFWGRLFSRFSGL